MLPGMEPLTWRAYLTRTDYLAANTTKHDMQQYKYNVKNESISHGNSERTKKEQRKNQKRTPKELRKKLERSSKE